MCRLQIKSLLGFVPTILQLFTYKTQTSASFYRLAKQPFSKPHIRRFSVTALPWGWSYQYEKAVEEKWARTHFSPFNSRRQRWPVDTPVDRSCDDVRRLINRLIDSRECTRTGFCEQIGVGISSFYAFMGQTGTWKGRKTDTFPLALHYFQQRERDGVPLSRKSSSKKDKPTTTRTTLVVLDGQEEDKVPVYDSCDQIRRKINAHMRKPGVNQTSFVRDLSAQFCSTPTEIRVSHLEKFRGGRGPNSQNANPVFYAAYVFFEKARINSGKEKSKHRVEMEKIYLGAGGVNVKVPSDKRGGWFGDLPPNSWITLDQYGMGSVDPYPSGTTLLFGPRGYTYDVAAGYEQRLFQYD